MANELPKRNNLQKLRHIPKIIHHVTANNQQLWKRIQRFDLDDLGSDFTFTDRLARENGWTFDFATRCIDEYKKFIFLICISGKSMTPSDQVDQVWHLHLIYTRSYWIDFCQNTLKLEIHHGPTKGGSSEKTKYNDQYEATKAYYKETFRKEPPEDIWPSSKIRFGELRFTRVNMHRNWVIPKFTFTL